MFKIEGQNKYGNWDASNVGGNSNDNLFETEEEAIEMLPILARDLECDIEQLRVVES